MVTDVPCTDKVIGVTNHVFTCVNPICSAIMWTISTHCVTTHVIICLTVLFVVLFCELYYKLCYHTCFLLFNCAICSVILWTISTQCVNTHCFHLFDCAVYSGFLSSISTHCVTTHVFSRLTVLFVVLSSKLLVHTVLPIPHMFSPFWLCYL